MATGYRTPLEQELDSALGEMLARNEALEAELATVKGQLDAMTSADGAVGVMRSIAHDASLPPELRYRAAAALAPYETAKKPATVHAKVYSLYDDLEGRRLKALAEREAARKTIEHQPLDLDGPIPGTFLGNDDPAA
jgi:hypothetical protein